jgi:hypothetical protein
MTVGHHRDSCTPAEHLHGVCEDGGQGIEFVVIKKAQLESIDRLRIKNKLR